MAGLSLAGLGKRYGAHPAVENATFELATGEFLAVLGASGCGKTTLLRLIAGFERADSGTIHLGGTLLSSPAHHIPAERRGIGIVFQNYALWPLMSVARNVGYPLEVRGMGRSERDRRVAAALESVGLAGFAERRPAELSGGQRQRVALARCLVMGTKLVLLDEPLASLDLHLRASLQDAIADLHRKSGAALLYITHDQAEAMALADRVAVMDAGRIAQIAPPAVIYREPATEMVARFVGRGGIVPVQVTRAGEKGRAPVDLFGCPAVVRCRADQPAGAALLCVRPEDLRLAARGEPSFEAVVKRTHYQGGSVAVELVPTARPGALLAMTLPGHSVLAAGQRVALSITDGWIVPAG